MSESDQLQASMQLHGNDLVFVDGTIKAFPGFSMVTLHHEDSATFTHVQEFSFQTTQLELDKVDHSPGVMFSMVSPDSARTFAFTVLNNPEIDLTGSARLLCNLTSEQPLS